MSDTDSAVATVVEDKRVPPDTQESLRRHWQQFGPTHGVITPNTIWDTVWNDGALTWVVLS